MGKDKKHKYYLSIEEANLRIKELAKEGRRSINAEINAAIEYWIQYQEKLKKPNTGL